MTQREREEGSLARRGRDGAAGHADNCHARLCGARTGAGGIPCVIYVSKSTEDRRGSIPDQLAQCRASIAEDARHAVHAEYLDEAVSGYRRDRGPGLRDALEHCEDLAAEHGQAELWAQHSDRLARGDGRRARHTVEIALWALKNNVRVHTLQDPDTFRDLLYAVVAGQRNNEDSKRKGAAATAGIRRAVARGEFVGIVPDGYKLVRTLTLNGTVERRLEFDAERQPLIELIFRLGLRGRTTGQIAATVNNRGWLTKPAVSGREPRPFTFSRIHKMLVDPRYASLAFREGSLLARDRWPAYISERQHHRLVERLQEAKRKTARGPSEAFLLRRIALCGKCGDALHSATRQPRVDGIQTRSYMCASHVCRRGSVQCDAKPLEAHVLEAMLVASLPVLLRRQDGASPESARPPGYHGFAADLIATQRETRARGGRADVRLGRARAHRSQRGDAARNGSPDASTRHLVLSHRNRERPAVCDDHHHPTQSIRCSRARDCHDRSVRLGSERRRSGPASCSRRTGRRAR